MILTRPKVIRTSTIAMSLDFLLKDQLAFLNQHFEIVAVSGEDQHLYTVGKREGVRTVGLKMQRSISLYKDVVSLVQMYLLFRKEKPQIVHSITPKAGLISMLAAKFAGVPIRIHSFTGLIFPTKTGVLQRLLIFMDRLLCVCATNVYPEGQGVKKDLIRYKITSKPLKVIANGNINGIDTTYFSKEQVAHEEKQTLKKKLGIDENDFVFIFVGRLVGDKGINELLLAFSKLATFSHPEPVEGHNLKLLLVGNFEAELDPLFPETLELIQNHPAIINVGFQKDVRPFMAISACLVFPSYREGFPNVVMQAGAMELPAIVTDINGCNEIIIEGQNGTIIPAKNAKAIQDAMKRMIQGKDYYNQLKRNARPMIESRYEQNVVWDALLKEYRSLENNV